MGAMRILPGILMMLALVGCSGGSSDSGRNDVERTSGNSGTTGGTGGTGGNTDGNTPPVATATGNLYLPTTTGVVWHYTTDGSGETVTAQFDGATSLDNKTLGNFVYSVGLTDYVFSDTTYIGYGGSAFSLTDGINGDVYTIDIKLKTAHPFIGQGAGGSYSGNGSLGVQPGNLQLPAVPYNGSTSVGSVSKIDAGDWGQVPARRVTIMLNPGGTLGDLGGLGLPEFLQPLLQRRTVDLWLAPGVGIVQRKDGELVRRLTFIDGIQKPLVFELSANAPTQPATQQVLVDDAAVTHQEWPVEILYRTNPTGWLTVEFDGTGSWRARLSALNQGVGLHAATIRFKRDSGDVDVPVILYIK